MDSKRILLIEDEQDIVTLMKVPLELQGHEVLVALDGKQAMGTIEQRGPEIDLIVLDRMLPEVSGLKICRYIRENERTQAIPILMVTALSRPEDIIEGLNNGADDYMVKPFDIKILIARVKALLRRYESLGTGTTKANVLDNGAIRVDRDQVKVFIHGQETELTKSEFKLLSALVENTGKVLTRKSLVQIVQGGSIHVTDRTIDTHVFGLRKKLGESSGMIETIRGIGYRIISQQ